MELVYNKCKRAGALKGEGGGFDIWGHRAHEGIVGRNRHPLCPRI